MRRENNEIQESWTLQERQRRFPGWWWMFLEEDTDGTADMSESDEGRVSLLQDSLK